MRFAPRQVELDWRADGNMLLRSPQKLGKYARCVTERLSQRSDRAAERVFLAERRAAGAWRKLSYREAYGAVRRVGQALLERKLDARRPVATVSCAACGSRRARRRQRGRLPGRARECVAQERRLGRQEGRDRLTTARSMRCRPTKWRSA
jgi:hypothetical protein